MKIIDIAFVCYAVSDLRTARPFYEKILELKPTKTYLMGSEGDKGMIEYDIGPGTLAIGCGAPMFKPGGNNVSVALEVEDFDAAIRRLREADAKFLMEPAEHPPCHMALIADPDGNPLMIHRRKNR